MNEKIARFFAEQQPATPCLVVDLDIVEENFRSLTAALPDAKIYYAVKANPAPEILSLLAAKGSSFDTASVPEIEMALAAGATPTVFPLETPSRSSATSRRLTNWVFACSRSTASRNWRRSPSWLRAAACSAAS